MAFKISKTCRNYWGQCSPVDELRSNKNICSPRVVFNVVRVRPTIFIAVMRVFLNPLTSILVLMIDIVPVRLLQTPGEVRSFTSKSWILPILVKRQNFCDLHGVHYTPFQPIILRASAHYPITYRGMFSDNWLACCKSACAEKGVWRESEISS